MERIKPYPWQQSSVVSVAGFLTGRKSYIDSSDTGTGKTVVTCVAAATTRVPLTVICPKSVVASWEDMAERTGASVQVTNYEQITTAKHPPFGRWIFDKQRFVFNDPGRHVIFDEAHRVNGDNTLQSLLLLSAHRTRIPVGLLSATLAVTPEKFRIIGQVFGLHGGQSPVRGFVDWMEAHGCKWSQIGGWKCDPHPRHMEKIHRDLRSRMLRLRVVDIPDFPDNQITMLPLRGEPIDPGMFSDPALDPEMDRLRSLMLARQRSELDKVDQVAELVRDAVENGLHPVVFMNFLETKDTLARKLRDLPVSQIFGEQTGVAREESIREFQHGKNRVMLAMIQAGGTGLNLQDKIGDRPRISFVLPTWNATEFRQALGRIHRVDAKTPALQRILWTLHSPIDEYIAANIERKLNCIDTLNDGDFEV